jgi:hypothetical protein
MSGMFDMGNVHNSEHDVKDHLHLRPVGWLGTELDRLLRELLGVPAEALPTDVPTIPSSGRSSAAAIGCRLDPIFAGAWRWVPARRSSSAAGG